MATATATRKPRASKFQTASQLKAAGVFDKPLKSRTEYAIGRGGAKRKPRNYFLTAAEIATYKAQYVETGEIPNPFNIGFSYYYFEALKSFAHNKNVAFERVLERTKELASAADTRDGEGKTFWQRFKNKPMRNESTGRNWLGRFEQNVEVLQRVEIEGRRNVNPYGQPLIDLGREILGTKGIVIDVVIGSAGKVMHRLNTDSNRPINETKRRAKAVVDATADAVETAVEPTAAVVETVEAPAAPVEVAPLPTVEAVEAPVAVEPTVETVPTSEVNA